MAKTQNIIRIGVRVLILITVLLGIFSLATAKLHAHSGRTDAYGGHNCYVGSCAGTYHYHDGSYTPVLPNYVAQGATNGKAHATREASDTQNRAKAAGYQLGYNDGSSGASRNYYIASPEYICNKTFTFANGTNESYITSYQSSYRLTCDVNAKSYIQLGYDSGYVAGTATKPKLEADSTSYTKSNDGNNDLWGWILMGAFISIVVIGVSWESIKKLFY